MGRTGRGGRRTWILAIVALAACSGGGPSGPEIDGSCIAGAQVDGRFYGVGEDLADPGRVGARVATVLRQVGCYDTPGTGDPDDTVKYDGDSNVMSVGTPIHEVEGADAARELTAYHRGAWVRLVHVQEGR